MNKILIKTTSLLFLILMSCSSASDVIPKKTMLEKNFINVSGLISLKEFEKIKEFVLKNGDRKLYRSYDSSNPHYEFRNFEVFLGADIGQKNPYNDSEISDFNQLVIADWDSDIRYYELIIVRQGDIKEEKTWIKKGMLEKQIYLVDNDNKGLKLLKNNLIYQTI